MAKAKQEGTKRPLCIVGTAPSIKDTPFDDESFEIWAISTALTREECGRVDRAFEMHPRRYWGIPAVTERLNEFAGPMYMQDHYDEIPNSVKFNYAEVREKYYHPTMGDNIFVGTTMVWMILLALYEGYTDISLYGVHMAHDTEYINQRATVGWALGLIQGMQLAGMPYRFWVHPDSQALKVWFEYGYGEETQTMQYLEQRKKGMELGIKQAQAQIDDLQRRKWMTEGAVSEVTHLYEKTAGFR